MSNNTATAVLKRMLEVPMKPLQKPTLVSLSKVHFEPVCVQAMSMCSTEELTQGAMVDPQAEEAAAEAAPGAADAVAGGEAKPADAAAGESSKYTEL